MKGNRTKGEDRKGGGKPGQAKHVYGKTLETERRKLERLDGKIALLRTWEMLEPDARYTEELRWTVGNLQKTLPR